MARVDAAINDPTPTGGVADRADVYRVAAMLIRQAGLVTDASPADLLELAQFLAGNDF
jgi:3-deoxy-D-manno-octulosonic acid (KDO) 8-phosphate synthase